MSAGEIEMLQNEYQRMDEFSGARSGVLDCGASPITMQLPGLLVDHIVCLTIDGIGGSSRERN
jgi:hypothetical protein